MNAFAPAGIPLPVILGALAVVALAALLILRRRRGRKRTLESVLEDIAYERIEGLVIPKADEGEIQIDNLVLTAQGLLIIDVKNVAGNVFGSDKMDQWTVISDDKRFTFLNPQPALYDRIA
ncbi:MAG: NERD domain-containing protein, partial [Gammaproteobacteria bacterium]|nr:NERD domain-containing protein [Gammaproteobacteria bacterium]